MQNYKFLIEYDGTRYNGWQRLKGNDNTIQGKLETVLSRMTDQEVQREREEILNVSQADIQALAGILEEILKTDALCAIGNGGQIRESSGMFCTTESLYH